MRLRQYFKEDWLIFAKNYVYLNEDLKNIIGNVRFNFVKEITKKIC